MIDNMNKWLLIKYHEEFNWKAIKHDHRRILIVSMVLLATFPIIKRILGVFNLEQFIPLRLLALYISSIFYFFSLVLYRVFCPKIIKNFKSFANFQEEEENPKRKLLASMENDCLFSDVDSKEYLDAKERNKVAYWMIFLNKYADRNFSDTEISNPKMEYLRNGENEIKDEKIEEAFVEIRLRESVSMLPLVVITKLSYIIALVLSFLASAQVMCQVFVPWNF